MKKKTKYIIFLVIFYFLFAVIADFILAQFFIKKTGNEIRVSDYYYHHGLKNNFNGKSLWGNEFYQTYTNSLGFIDSNRRKIEYKNNFYRVLFIGDSFTEGIGLPFDSTFVGILKSKYTNIDILNAAVASYSPKLYFLKIKYLIEKKHFKFNELIVFLDISDISDEIIYENYVPESNLVDLYKERVFKYFKFNSLIYNRIHGLKKNETQNKIVISYNKKLKINNFDYTKSIWTIDEKSFNEWGKKGVQLALENMRNLHELCQKNDIKLTIAVYPWITQIKNNDFNSKQVVIWKTFAEEHDIQFINFFSEFSNDNDIEKYFINGDIHWNKFGHKKIAEKISNLGLFK